MKIGMEFFMRLHRFKQLKISDKLKTLPDNGHIVLGMLLFNEKQHGEATISCTEIANELCVSTAAVSRTLKNLRENGLITTTTDYKDRRGAIISLTELGRKTLIDDCNRLENLMQKAAENIPHEDIEMFFKTFDALYNGISAELGKTK